MVGIQGVHSGAEPAGPIPASGTQGRAAAQAAPPPASDGVAISPEAAVAQHAVRTQTESEIRQHLVEEAKQRIEQGAYRLQQVVLTVAARVSKFVE